MALHILSDVHCVTLWTIFCSTFIKFAYYILCMDFVPGPEHPPLTPQPITPRPAYVVTLRTSRPQKNCFDINFLHLRKKS